MASHTPIRDKPALYKRVGAGLSILQVGVYVISVKPAPTKKLIRQQHLRNRGYINKVRLGGLTEN